MTTTDRHRDAVLRIEWLAVCAWQEAAGLAALGPLAEGRAFEHAYRGLYGAYMTHEGEAAELAHDLMTLAWLRHLRAHAEADLDAQADAASARVEQYAVWLWDYARTAPDAAEAWGRVFQALCGAMRTHTGEASECALTLAELAQMHHDLARDAADTPWRTTP